MKRPAAALLVPIAAFLVACGTSESGGPKEVGDGSGGDGSDAFVPVGCKGGCLCFPVDTCPAGCYPSRTEQILQPDGAAPEPFCSNGIVQCVDGGLAWSLGTPANNCPTGRRPIYLDGGPAPSGAFCCEYEPAPEGGQDAGAPVACTSVDDCQTAAPSGSTVFCCLDKVCAYSGGAPLIACGDADVQLIEASSYDQSCTMDSDCVAVPEGNFCYPGANNCPSAAINNGALARYKADIATTNAAVCGAASACGSFTGPCCRGGSCSLGVACASAADAGDLGAE